MYLTGATKIIILNHNHYYNYVFMESLIISATKKKKNIGSILLGLMFWAT